MKKIISLIFLIVISLLIFTFCIGEEEPEPEQVHGTSKSADIFISNNYKQN